MKKATPFIGMLLVIVAVFLFANIEGLLAEPAIDAEAFLQRIPHQTISFFGRELIITQPSSTILVFGLGILTISFGVFFFATHRDQESRRIWGIGLILWGLGTLFAGSSYQAFTYQLKCAGRDACLYTSRFEIAYLLLTCYSIACFMIATAHTSSQGNARRALIRFAYIDSVAYTVLVLIGAIIPIRFLISYEGFLILLGGNFVIMFVCVVLHYRRHRDVLNKRFLFIWVALLAVNIAYFAWLYSGVSQLLYDNWNVWFNENDCLHLLLVLWMIEILLMLKEPLKDLS
ncbi:MAG: hypothetical protein C0413_02280 [Clostridiales bacterium]|nr:hypothetical protein [Clostridiales bacterium]